MLRRIIILVVSVFATALAVSAQCPANEIWYTTTDGTKVSAEKLGECIIAHTYQDGKGIIRFDKPVTNIGKDAFYACRNLQSIVLPDGVVTIGDRAFSYCLKLTTITIPNSVTEIGNWAFEGCKSLTSITIPDSVTNLHAETFKNCENLTSIICLASIPPKFWDANISDLIIYVPQKSVKLYKHTYGWSLHKKLIKPIKKLP